MAWSLQHSGVACLVLKSSSLTFQQILPGGWGVCHTTPSIHTALFTLLPHPLLPPPPSCSRASGHSASHLFYFIFHIRIDWHIWMCRCGSFESFPEQVSKAAPGVQIRRRSPNCVIKRSRLTVVAAQKSHSANKSYGKDCSIHLYQRRLKKLFDSFHRSLHQPMVLKSNCVTQSHSKHMLLRPAFQSFPWVLQSKNGQ